MKNESPTPETDSLVTHELSPWPPLLIGALPLVGIVALSSYLSVNAPDAVSTARAVPAAAPHVPETASTDAQPSSGPAPRDALSAAFRSLSAPGEHPPGTSPDNPAAPAPSSTADVAASSGASAATTETPAATDTAPPANAAIPHGAPFGPSIAAAEPKPAVEPAPKPTPRPVKADATDRQPPKPVAKSENTAPKPASRAKATASTATKVTKAPPKTNEAKPASKPEKTALAKSATPKPKSGKTTGKSSKESLSKVPRAIAMPDARR